MGKGANKSLLSNSGVASSNSQNLYNTAGNVGNFVTPQLEGDVTNPKGFTPQQKAYMDTASQQSLGGSVAGVTGQANLEAARTRNKGGFQGAIASGSRAAQRQLSQNAVGVEVEQAKLQQQQRQQALEALSKMYGVDLAAAGNYMNTSDQALNYENEASGANSLLGKSLLGMIQAGGQVGAAAAAG